MANRSQPGAIAAGPATIRNATSSSAQAASNMPSVWLRSRKRQLPSHDRHSNHTEPITAAQNNPTSSPQPSHSAGNGHSNHDREPATYR